MLRVFEGRCSREGAMLVLPLPRPRLSSLPYQGLAQEDMLPKTFSTPARSISQEGASCKKVASRPRQQDPSKDGVNQPQSLNWSVDV